jgi:hypothetical protein
VLGAYYSQLAAQCATVSEDTQPKRSVLTVARTAKETKTKNERILVQQEKKNDDFAGVEDWRQTETLDPFEI